MRRHLPHLDGLRACAALTVLFSHVFSAFGYHAEWYKALRLVAVTLAHDAVVVFLALSGFCLFIPILQRDFRYSVAQFYKRRAARILPPYYFAILVYWLLFGFIFTKTFGSHLWPQERHFTWQGLLMHLTFTSHYVDNREFNTAFWSVTLEENIYLLLPLLVLGCRRVGIVFSAVAALVLVFAAQLWANPVYSASKMSMLPVFLIGAMGASVVFGKGAARLVKLPWGWISLVLIGAFVSTFGFEMQHQIGLWRNIAIAVVSAAVMIAGCKQSRICVPLTLRPLCWVGTFSYSLYLMHGAAVKIIANLWYGADTVLLWTLSVAGAILLSYGFYLLAEKPALAWRSKFREPERNEIPDRTDSALTSQTAELAART